MRSSLRSHAKDTPPGNYIIELRGIKLNKISASISVLTTSIDNNQFLGGNIGIHGANAALGFAVGNLRGKDHKQFIFADITNYFRIIPLSFSRGRWAPVIGYDFGITSIDHKSFAMTGINVGPSYTNYKSYSLALLTRFAALLTQTESKFITMPGLEMRYFF